MLKRKDRNRILVGMLAWLGSIFYLELASWSGDLSAQMVNFILNSRPSFKQKQAQKSFESGGQLSVSNIETQIGGFLDTTRNSPPLVKSPNMGFKRQFVHSSEEDSLIDKRIPKNLKKPRVSGHSKASLVRINAASQAKLETLKGIGPKTALKIIQLRESKGEIKSLRELKEVKGLGNKKLNLIKDHITFN